MVKSCTKISAASRTLGYCHETKTSSWLPPVESWDSGGIGLPYGWEAALDREGKTYFINHVNKTTTSEDPRKDSDEEPPLPRDVELYRDPQKGFGFVAGSEKPVIVRFVTEGGPSDGKLLPGDQILQINDEDVEKSPRERVIELVRSCKHSVKIKVCQPQTNNTTRKSALLTAAKKAKLKSNPSRVRFAEGVVINGSPLYCPSPFESYVPFMPNVLKVFLENGQTKSFKYDSTTTVQEVLNVLQEKLSIKCLDHFSLVVEHIKSLRRNKLSILNPKDTLAKIAARPGAHHLRCLFRLTFVPKDIYELMQRDPVAFDYLFVQCCNDVVRERFAPELKYDVALRLSALHLQQHATSSGIQGKMVVKTIEREYGLEKFVPISLLDTMKRKELLKLLSQLLKQNQALSGPGQKQLTSLQAKFHYLKIVSELPSYGAKSFSTSIKNSPMETALLIGPRIGISQISTIRNIAPINLAHFSELESIEVTKEDEFSYKLKIRLRHPEKESLNLSMEDRETEELVFVLERYYSQLVGGELPVQWEGRDPEPVETVPTFHSRHTVQEAPWSYCPSPTAHQTMGSTTLRTIDLAVPPPPYIQCEERQLSRSNSRDQFSLATSPASVDHNMNEMQALVAAITAIPINLVPTTIPLKEQNNEPQKDQNHSLSTQKAITSDFAKDANCDISKDHQNITSEEDSDEIFLEPPTLNSVTNHTESTRNVQHLAGKTDTVAVQLQRQTYQSSGIDMHSVMSMELLEEETEEGALEEMDVKSKDVIDRVTEMSKIVTDAELYLMSDSDDPNQVNPANETRADLGSRCHDSLLFISRSDDEQVTSDMFDHLLTPSSDAMPSESEAESTPTNSPTHCSTTDSPKSLARKLCSSFGLHSPHMFATMDQETEDIEELLRQLQSSTNVPFEEGTLCLDPDIIDLTIIPPPAAEDVDFCEVPEGMDHSLRSTVDHRQVGTPIRNVRLHSERDSEINATQENSNEDLPRIDELPDHSQEPTATAAHRTSLSCTTSLESFLASVAIPPPPVPSTHSSGSEAADCSTESGASIPTATGEDDISAYIIPPPPSSSRVVEEQNRVLARFRQAAEDIRKMMAHGTDVNSFSGGKYSDSMNSVSKFCTIPRRHDDSHRTPLSSLASLVTPVRETHGKIVTSSGTATTGSKTGSDTAKSDNKTSDSLNNAMNNLSLSPKPTSESASPRLPGSSKNKDEDWRPQPPPRLKRLNSVSSESLSSAGDSSPPTPPVSSRSPSLENAGCGVNDSSGNSKGPFSRTLSLDSFKGVAHRTREQTSQNACPVNAHLFLSSSSDNSLPHHRSHNLHSSAQGLKPYPLVNGHHNHYPHPQMTSETHIQPHPSLFGANGNVTETTNGHHSYMNGSHNGDGPGLADELYPLPMSLGQIKECADCVGRKGPPNGCVCRKLNRFLSYHQSLPRKAITARLHAVPVTIINGVVENGYDSVHASGPFHEAEQEIEAMVLHLDSACEARLKVCSESTCREVDVAKLTTVRETLMSESRQFVTASKLFVKSITESSDKMEENLGTCLSLLDRIFAVSELVVMEMTTASHISNLVEKLKEMALAYSRTVRAAHCAASGGIPNPNMAGLMHQATSLATSLTTFMRTLRTFNTP